MLHTEEFAGSVRLLSFVNIIRMIVTFNRAVLSQRFPKTCMLPFMSFVRTCYDPLVAFSQNADHQGNLSIPYE